MAIAPTEQELAAFGEISQRQQLMRKRLSAVFGLTLLAATPSLILLPAETNSELRNLLSVVAMLCIFSLVFIGRAALIVIKMQFRNQRTHARILEFTETDDFKLQPGEALLKIRERRENERGRR